MNGKTTPVARHPYTRRAALIGLAAAALTVMTSTMPVYAGKAPIYTGLVRGTAVGGYDAVAYFTQGRAVKGSTKHTTKYKGATWRFASAANLAKFKSSPGRYAPAFGGYCAWAVSQGYTAKGDPRHWKVVGGKLYLNYSAGVQRQWERNQAANIASGRANWPSVLN